MAREDKDPVRVTRDGTTLVAAYPTASPPLVWKFDLDRNHSFTFRLQGEEGNWALGVTSPRDEFHPVARFRSRQDAEEAFEETQFGLLKKKGNIWRPIALMLVGVLALMIIYVLPIIGRVASMQSAGKTAGHPAVSSTQSPYASMQDQEQAPPLPPPPPPLEMKDGVPMTADQVLRPPP